MNRRQLLQALGLTSGSLFLPSRGLATGQTTPPRRIIFYVSDHGTVYDTWKMRPGGQGEDVHFDVDLTTLAPNAWSPILAPLERHANQVMVLDGLAHATSVVSGFNEHEEGSATCLTGDVPIPVPGGRGRATKPSLDQILAGQATTPIRSLEYALRNGWEVTFNQQGVAVPYERDPVAAFERLFPTSGTSTGTPARVARHQQSVLDLAAQQFDTLLPTLGTEDRIKLETHRDLVRDLELQVAALGTQTCIPPTAPRQTYMPSLETMQAFTSMTVAAMACGLTNIMTIRAGQIANSDIGAPPGDLHVDVAHQANTEPGAAAIMTDFHLWYANRFAEILDALAAIPEDGGTMLDHTLVVWTNELSTGSHTHDNLPIVVAGGGGCIRSGTLVRYAPQYTVQGPFGVTDIGEPHNKLLVSLARLMGLSTAHVGVTSVPLSDGSTLPVTGDLPRFLA